MLNIDTLNNEKVIQTLIYQLYYNCLESDDFKDLEQTRVADNKVGSFIHGLNIDKSAGFNLDMLIAESEFEREKQGFYYGFKCAVELMAGVIEFGECK